MSELKTCPVCERTFVGFDENTVCKRCYSLGFEESGDGDTFELEETLS